MTTLFRHRLFLPYVSCGIGVLSLLAVLCFHFPDQLTSQEFRAIYTEHFVRTLLLIGIALSFIMGTMAIMLDQSKRVALVGLLSATTAVILGGTTIEFDKIEKTPYSLGLDWFILALFFSAVVFVPLEHYFGRKPLAPLRLGWRTDAVYFFSSHIFVQFILIFVTATTTFVTDFIQLPKVEAWVGALPFVSGFLLAVFFADLAQAVVHRAYHRITTLWRFHAIHHSSRELDWLAGSRIHFLETMLTRSAVLLPLLVLGFNQDVVNAYIILVGAQAVIAHANIGINFGFLEKVLVLPRYHHWHHARHKDYWDCNYAIHIPLVDMLMGTYRLPKDGSWPEEYGVLKLETVPEGFVAQLIMPFQGGKEYDNFVK